MQHFTRTFLRASLIIVLLAVALPLPQPHATRAQGPELLYNTPVEGSITDAALEQDWTLTTQGADRIHIEVERLDGNLMPDVWIFDSNGVEVARSYGPEVIGAIAVIDDVDLPAAGTYTIRVTRDRGADGLTSGSYRLTVTPLGLGVDHPNITTIIGPVDYDTPVTGTLTHEEWQHVYTLDGEIGDAVAITAQRINGTLIPEVALVDNNGQEVRRGFAYDAQEIAEFTPVELPYTGQYTVFVYRQQNIDGVTQGDYELTVHLRGAGEESARFAAVEPGTITQYNEPIAGEITHALWRQDWQFRTEAADRITIHVQRVPPHSPDTPNNLRPMVILLDANGDELRRGYVNQAGDGATITEFTVPKAALYTIRVARDREKDGPTTGTYELTVYLDGAGEGSPFLEGVEGAVEAGTPVTGALTNARWMHVYAFTGEADQEFAFTVTRTDGTLIPNLDIRDSNGQSLRYRYAAPTQDMAFEERFRLPYAGEYQIVVLRDRGQDGATTGGYELLITPIAQ